MKHIKDIFLAVTHFRLFQDCSSSDNPVQVPDGLSFWLLLTNWREKNKIFFEFLRVFPVFLILVSMFFLDNLRDNNICNGREEDLRFNINNFLKPVFYNEFVIQLPLHHPYTILILINGTEPVVLVKWYDGFFQIVNLLRILSRIPVSYRIFPNFQVYLESWKETSR